MIRMDSPQQVALACQGRLALAGGTAPDANPTSATALGSSCSSEGRGSAKEAEAQATVSRDRMTMGLPWA